MTKRLESEELARRQKQRKQETKSKFIQKIGNIALTLLNKFENEHEPYFLKCNICDHEFKLSRKSRIKRSSCKKCAKIKKAEKNKIKFINLAKQIHGDQYDYSKVIYINNSNSVQIRCKKHDSFFPSLPATHTSKAKRGGCPECYREEQSDSIEFVASEVVKRGGILLDSLSGDRSYVRSEQRIKIQCKACNKIWTPKWRDLKVNNRWCGICTVTYAKALSFEQVKDLVKKQVEILQWPDNPINFVQHTDVLTFKCKCCGSVESKSLHAVKQNFLPKSGQIICNNCSGFKQSKAQQYVKDFVEENGYTLMRFPDNGKIKKVKVEDRIFVKCDRGHTPYSVKWANFQSGKRCPHCRSSDSGDRFRFTQEEYEQKLLQTSPKIKCLEEYKNTKTPILHLCSVCMHEWKVMPASPLNGAGCPECGKSHYREGWCREVLEQIFDMPFKSIRPSWLINCGTGRTMELDCYNEELQLAVEYQGRQHYEPVPFFGGDEVFAKQQTRDRIKTNLCLGRKIVLWRLDNRRFAGLQEEEFKNAVKKEIISKALSAHYTPSWMPTMVLIRSFFKNNLDK